MIQYQYLNQRDPQWANIKINNTSMNIGDIGCLVTSVAMMGKTTPDVVVANSKFVAGTGNFIWNSFRNSEIEWVHRQAGQARTLIETNLRNQHGVIIEVAVGNSFGGRHFMLATHFDNGGVFCINPDPRYDNRQNVKVAWGSIVGSAHYTRFNNKPTQNNMPNKHETNLSELRKSRHWNPLSADPNMQHAFAEQSYQYIAARINGQAEDIKDLQKLNELLEDKVKMHEKIIDSLVAESNELLEDIDSMRIGDKPYQESRESVVAITDDPQEENQPYQTPALTIMANDTAQRTLAFIESIGGATAGLALLSPQLEAVNIDITTGIIGVALAGLALLVDKYLESEKIKRKRKSREND